MSTLRLAGTLWLMAGVVCAGLLSFVLIGEHINDLGALLANLALPARVLGGPLVVTTVAAALGGYEFGPVVSSSLITGLGVAGALVTFRAGRAGRRLA